MAGEAAGGENRMHVAVEIDCSETHLRRQYRGGEHLIHYLPSCNSASGPSTSTIRTVSFLRLCSADSGTSNRATIMRSIDCRAGILSRMIRLSLNFCPSTG